MTTNKIVPAIKAAIRCLAQIEGWQFGKSLFPLVGVLALASVAAAQDDVYSNYSELPIDERYQQESLAPRLTQNVFEEIPEKEKKEIVNRNRAKRTAIADDKRRVDTLLESGGDLNDPVMASFFGGYVFPEMTQLGDQTYDKLSNLGTLRADFLKNFLSPKVSGQTRQRFIETISIPKLKEIYANQTLHPAARLNAVYLLGMLDITPGSRSPAIAPTPSSLALDELLSIMSSNELDGYLKVGAWSGIQRHLEIDTAVGNQIADGKKNQIKQSALQIVAGSFAGQDSWEADLSYWMKRRSVQMLGLVKDPETLSTMVEVLNNPNNRFWLRFDAMEAIEKLAANSVNNQLVEAVGQFLADSIAAESKWINDEKQSLINDNLLFQDIDLELTGTDWSADGETAPAGGGGRGGAGPGRGGGGRGDLGMGGLGLGTGGDLAGGLDGPGEPGMGESRGGGSRFGGGGGGGGGRGGLGGGLGGGTTTESTKKFVELPNYMLNVSRRRIKSLAFVGKRVLKPTENRGLHAVADQEMKTKINRMVEALDRLLAESNVGLVNLGARRTRRGSALDEEVVPTKSITDQLAEACTKAAERLSTTLKPKDPAVENPLGG